MSSVYIYRAMYEYAPSVGSEAIVLAPGMPGLFQNKVYVSVLLLMITWGQIQLFEGR